MGEVDSSYRLLFTQARMIRDLLEGFVREDWVRRVDFSSLELQSGSYVSETMKRLEQDFVWKARLDGEDLYVYVLLEVQSRPDPSMALRMFCYLASFYDGLTRQAPPRARLMLPPVLPIVLFSGQRRWRGPTQFADLVEPVTGGLERYVPRFEYLLLDEKRIVDPDLREPNLANALFQLEQAGSPRVMLPVLGELATFLEGEENASLRRAFSAFIGRVMAGLGVNEELPDNFMEARTMIEERVLRWERNLRREAEAAGEARGKAEGKAEVLLRLLSKRFGGVEPGWSARIRGANESQLDAWTDRVLDANFANEVFEAPEEEG